MTNSHNNYLPMSHHIITYMYGQHDVLTYGHHIITYGHHIITYGQHIITYGQHIMTYGHIL